VDIARWIYAPAVKIAIPGLVLVAACGTNESTSNECRPLASPADNFESPGLACDGWGTLLHGQTAYRKDGALVIDNPGFPDRCIDGYDMSRGLTIQLRHVTFASDDGSATLSVELAHDPSLSGNFRGGLDLTGDGMLVADDDFGPVGQREYVRGEMSWWRVLPTTIDNKPALSSEYSSDGITWSTLGSAVVHSGTSLAHATVAIYLENASVSLESMNCAP